MKNARLFRDGPVNGLPCIWLQDAGGTSAYTLLPDTRAVSYGITDIEDKKYSIVWPPVGSLPVLRNTIYNQINNKQEDLRMKRIYLYPNVSQTPSLSRPIHFWFRVSPFDNRTGGNPSESTGFKLRWERFFYILVLAYKTTASHVSYIGSVRMTISVVHIWFG